MLALSVGILSAAALGYEVLLMRLFTEAWWQPFASTVISLALLGYGASGSVLTLLQDRLVGRFGPVYRGVSLAFAATAPLGAAVALRLPLNPLDLAWSPSQWAWFAALYGILTVPFLLAAFCVGLALRVYGDRIAQLYAADLCGAGCGAALVVLVLYGLPPERVVAGVGMLACLGSLAAWRLPEKGSRRSGWMRSAHPWGAVLLALGMLLAPSHWFAAQGSPYKGIRQRLRVPGAEVLEQRLHPTTRVEVVDPGQIPLRHASGLSLHCTAPIPPQRAVYADGEFVGAVDQGGIPYGERAYLECLPLAAPYEIGAPETVAALSAGSGSVVSTALHYGVPRITAVEGTRPLVELLAEAHPTPVRSGQLEFRQVQPRTVLAGTRMRWDLIQLSTADGGGGAPGLLSTAEDYLLTVEGVGAMLEHLELRGVLSVTVGFQVPPQESIKLFATAVRALREAGVSQPGKCLAWFRTWNTSTVLARPAGWSPDALSRLEAFCRQRAFDLCYYPGIPADAANRYNVLEEPYLFEAAQALLGPRAEEYLDHYSYYVTPATDDQPFFHRFFRWGLVPQFWEARGRGGEALLPWGYLLTVAALVQALLAGAVLILLPLGMLHRRRGGSISSYFTLVGIGFMLVEIAVLKRLTLLVGHPVLAAAVALSVFLLFAGWGSQRLGAHGQRSALGEPWVACLGVAGMIAVVQGVWWATGAGADGLPLAVRSGLYIAVTCALAYAMGRPFPAGLSQLAGVRPEAVPWAWGVNGFASVWSVTAGTLLAVHFGFHACLWSAAVLYAGAGWVAWRRLPG